MILTRDSILAADDLRRESVDVPEWGGSVIIRTMTGSERDAFEAEHLKDPSKDLRARLAVHTVCDEQGQLCFAPSDVAAIGQKNAAALDRIFAVAIKINGISKQDVAELGNVSEPTT